MKRLRGENHHNHGRSWETVISDINEGDKPPEKLLHVKHLSPKTYTEEQLAQLRDQADYNRDHPTPERQRGVCE